MVVWRCSAVTFVLRCHSDGFCFAFVRTCACFVLNQGFFALLTVCTSIESNRAYIVTTPQLAL
jgi:hypothetical protein